MSQRNTLPGDSAPTGARSGTPTGAWASLRSLFSGPPAPSGQGVPAARSYDTLRTESEWQQLLSREQYQVLRRAGTERSGSSPLNKEQRAGTFTCAGCAAPLFSSKSKFESGTGWPSFWQAMDQAVVEESDSSLFMQRVEVLCRGCGGHLGHVFDDGPQPTGMRYCMNGVALNFKPT